ncbi:tautomerase family protein [Paraburkholderia sp. CNPSo 3274]|nr:tautomerase family protein [Paraburkholderia sp. CNPSo 3274]MCP3708682.1 tautomerase family protein [Paraburkholderia sp. CNPSo 3274]
MQTQCGISPDDVIVSIVENNDAARIRSAPGYD